MSNFLNGTVLIIAASLLPCAAAYAQTQGPEASRIIERVPNVIKTVGPYNEELMIEGDVIVERTPCQPTFPLSSLRNGETGVVILKLMIAKSGFVSRAKVVETSGFKELDRAAMVGYLGCKFKPALQNGVPVETWINVRHIWSIE